MRCLRRHKARNAELQTLVLGIIQQGGVGLPPQVRPNESSPLYEFTHIHTFIHKDTYASTHTQTNSLTHSHLPYPQYIHTSFSGPTQLPVIVQQQATDEDQDRSLEKRLLDILIPPLSSPSLTPPWVAPAAAVLVAVCFLLMAAV